mgnify:FL=1
MSQYTDKINQIAKDFAEIEEFEKLSALEGRDGMLITHYNHGGKKIEYNRDSEYEGTTGIEGEVKIIPPVSDRYKDLFDKYNKENKTVAEWLAERWKKFKGI